MTQMDFERQLVALLPEDIRRLGISDKTIPQIARDRALTSQIESVIPRLPSTHRLYEGDARKLTFLQPESIHLAVTSPPYWTLKRYRDHDDQLGHVSSYEAFLESLDLVWQRVFNALVPGGRLVCVVGDVCLSRRKNNGRHTVVPLHASIQDRCRNIGYDNLAPIIWHKIANATFEVAGGGGFLGKPYEPNAVIKNDIEFILMQRKPGGYRKPSPAKRALSVIAEDRHRKWFQQIWHGITGASTRNHPAPYPEELVERLIRMFSFVGDTVLDPFVGSGTTTIAAARCGRNSIGVEVDPEYFAKCCQRVHAQTRDLFDTATVEVYPRKASDHARLAS